MYQYVTYKIIRLRHFIYLFNVEKKNKINKLNHQKTNKSKNFPASFDNTHMMK